MKILITGGTGYLGGRIIQHLHNLGNNEIIIGSRFPIKNTLPRGLKSVQTIWSSTEELMAICSGVEIIIHLAGMNASDSFNDPEMALEINGHVTGRLLAAAVRMGVKRFIYFSTAHVYGGPLQGTITEKSLTTSSHPYATSHRVGEDLVMASNMRNEIEGIVIRLSNSFGAPLTKGANCWMLLANDLCRQIAISGEMELSSSGLQRRDFITMTNVCRSIEHLLKMPIQSGNDNLFNVGGDWSTSIWEFACLIQELSKKVVGFGPKLKRVEPVLSDETEDFKYSIAKLQQTGFTLVNNREEELLNLIKGCQIFFPKKI